MNIFHKYKQQITLVASLFFSCIYSLPSQAAATDNSQAKTATTDSIKTKTISIFNDTDKPLYVVVQTSMNPIDEWLQGANEVTNDQINSSTYGHTKLYRIYVNGSDGIPAKGSAKLQIPFYSVLVDNPSPTTPDQYINWWNGGRIYFYDNKTDLQKALSEDQANPVSPKTPGPSCLDNSCSNLTIYSGTAGLLETARSQLAEYTFASVIKGPEKYTIDYGNVDYDISYVDHVYLPIALEPEGNFYIGYSGSTKTKGDFVQIMENFLAPGAIGEGWPIYIIPDNPKNDKKLPGAYNAFALVVGQDITQPGKAVQQMEQLWSGCLNPKPDSKCDDKMKQVLDYFNRNYQKYQTTYADCKPRVQNTTKEMLKHIYGWVPFNEGCGDAKANALKDTDGYLSTHSTYRQLQYSPDGIFNPYVKLIHGPDFLAMSAYAFSIDDAVGNMQELGSGLIATVGGPEGLINKKPYDPKNSIIVNLGSPSASGPDWVSYGACPTSTQDCKPNMSIPDGILNFKIGTFDFPYTAVFEDSMGRMYQFNVNHAPPFDGKEVSACKVDKKDSPWCDGIQPNKQIDHLTGHDVYYINVSAPPAKSPDQGGICTGRKDSHDNIIPCCDPTKGQLCPPNGTACPACGGTNCECPVVTPPDQGGVCTGKVDAQGNPIPCCNPKLGQLCPPNNTQCPNCGGDNCECPIVVPPPSGAGTCTGRADSQGNPIPCCNPKAADKQLCPPNGSACPDCGTENCECPTGQ